jgi:NAD(P)-dependent dehydrogenase (short-subunit alcohol dehydrogenase family)
MESSEKRLAVVTGASSGIGFELARLLSEDGFELIVAAEDDDIVTAARELGEADAVQVDLSNEDGVRELHRRLEAAGRWTSSC